MPLKLELGANRDLSKKRFSACSYISGRELPNIFEECEQKSGAGSPAKLDTADSSNNNTKKRSKIKTFYDYCQEDEKIIEANRLPYLQGLET